MKTPKSKGKQVVHAQKGGDLAFKYLSEEKCNIFLQIGTAAELEKLVAEYLNLFDNDINMKSGILIDYYVSIIWHCKEQQMNAAQLSSAYSAAHILLENIKDKNLALIDNLQELKAMLAGIAVDDAEKSGGLEYLSSEQVKHLLNYFKLTLLQHYSLYQFLFHNAPSEEILGTDLLIETAPLPDIPFPPPLVEGIPGEIFEKYVAKKKAKTKVPDTSVQDQEQAGTEEISTTTVITPPTADDAYKEKSTTENGKLTADEIFSELTPEQVSSTVDEMCKEMLAGLEQDIMNKIRERENNFINRINKIHKIAD